MAFESRSKTTMSWDLVGSSTRRRRASWQWRFKFCSLARHEFSGRNEMGYDGISFRCRSNPCWIAGSFGGLPGIWRKRQHLDGCNCVLGTRLSVLSHGVTNSRMGWPHVGVVELAVGKCRIGDQRVVAEPAMCNSNIDARHAMTEEEGIVKTPWLANNGLNSARESAHGGIKRTSTLTITGVAERRVEKRDLQPLQSVQHVLGIEQEEVRGDSFNGKSEGIIFGVAEGSVVRTGGSSMLSGMFLFFCDLSQGKPMGGDWSNWLQGQPCLVLLGLWL